MRRTFTTFKKFALTFSVLALVAEAGLVLVLELEFEVFREAPVISHRVHAGTGSACRMVIHPLLALDWAETHLGSLGVPRTLLERVLPREVAALIESKGGSAEAEVLIFVNEQRLGPLAVLALAQARALPDIPGLVWGPMGFEQAQRGCILARGKLPIRPEFQSISGRTSAALPPDSLVAGDRPIEILFDNRDGAVLAALFSLHAASIDTPLPYTPGELARNLEIVQSIHALGSLGTADEIAIELEIRCSPDATEERIAELAFLSDVVRGEIHNWLWSTHKLSLNGSLTRDANRLQWELRLAGLTEFIKGLRD